MEAVKSIEPVARADLIPPEDVHIWWPAALRVLAEPLGMTGGRLSPESVLCWLVGGQFQLWVVRDGDGVQAASVTEVRTYPTGLRALNIVVLGGAHRERWLHVLSEIEAWAEQRGCSRLEMAGRKGWGRILTDWKQTTVDMEKELFR